MTAPNRFYQVPHCSGMGFAMPNALRAMREVKAEGGWGVVCTEYCSTDPSSDNHPHPFCTLWDDADQNLMAGLAEAIHGHGALAGVELWMAGYSSRTNLTRTPPVAATSMPTKYAPLQTRHMDKADLKELRHNHRAAALRAKAAEMDIVYVYASHGNLPLQFLSPVQNQRTDEYGGSFENRARLLRELLEDTHDAVGDRCAVALRFAVATLDADIGIEADGEGRDLVEYLAELPDLWDVNIGGYPMDARTARFAEEGAQEAYVDFVKTVTTKPVVTVGRYTSPDLMAARVRKGKTDFVGAARPSIADPFLPRKIAEGRIEDIRECIGCNICVMSDAQGVPIRCTQNPTMGEEYTRGWHPEHIPPRDDPVTPGGPGAAEFDLLVVGGGPAGLEAARAAGQQGYRVALAEAGTQLGGRAVREARLAGLSSFRRVADWRIGQIAQMANVEVFFDSRLTADDILEFGAPRVCVATGASWRTDGTGRSSFSAIDGLSADRPLSPDAIMDGAAPTGRVVLYDDDHFYLASALAETLVARGAEVIFVTGADIVSPLCVPTLEQPAILRRMMALGIDIVTSHKLARVSDGAVECVHLWSGQTRRIDCRHVVPVTSREPSAGLFQTLRDAPDRLAGAGIRDLRRIGDCDAPGLIAHAVHAGHAYARSLNGPQRVRRDRTALHAQGHDTHSHARGANMSG